MFERIMGVNVIDEAEYRNYRGAMLPVLASFGGAFGYDFRISEVLLSKTEGKINRVFTIEFPSKQKMEDFFSFPVYLAIQNKYLKTAIDSKTIIAMHETTP